MTGEEGCAYSTCVVRRMTVFSTKLELIRASIGMRDNAMIVA